jgi:hypothetical protein
MGVRAITPQKNPVELFDNSNRNTSSKKFPREIQEMPYLRRWLYKEEFPMRRSQLKLMALANLAALGLSVSTVAQVNSFDINSKKVICTATINSPDEVEVMKYRFAGQNVEFVELVPQDAKFNPNYNDNEGRLWMNEACRRGVQCDVLLISGHFAGTFLGDVGKQSLSTRALMEMSCDPACKGVLKNPTEVYLMGCNTLKGKAVNETRTPEQYFTHLVSHGYSPDDARRATVMTFSSVGATNKVQMERIFSDAPKIYGFSGLAPRGADVRSSWDIYIRGITDINLHLQRMRNGERNSSLTSALSWTPITGTKGAKLNVASGFDEQRSCAVASNKFTLESRFRALLEILNQNNRMDYFLEFSSLIRQTHGRSLKSQERNLLRQLQRHEQLRSDLMAARAALDYNLTLQFQVSDTQFLLGHLSQSEAIKFMSARIIQELNEKQLSDLEAQDICRIVKERQLSIPGKQTIKTLITGFAAEVRFNDFCRSVNIR